MPRHSLNAVSIIAIVCLPACLFAQPVVRVLEPTANSATAAPTVALKGVASCWRPCAPDLPFPVAFLLLQFRVGRPRGPSPHDPRWLREDILQKLLQNLLYQFREFAESRFHVAAKMHAQRAAVAVG